MGFSTLGVEIAINVLESRRKCLLFVWYPVSLNSATNNRIVINTQETSSFLTSAAIAQLPTLLMAKIV